MEKVDIKSGQNWAKAKAKLAEDRKRENGWPDEFCAQMQKDAPSHEEKFHFCRPWAKARNKRPKGQKANKSDGETCRGQKAGEWVAGQIPRTKAKRCAFSWGKIPFHQTEAKGQEQKAPRTENEDFRIF